MYKLKNSKIPNVEFSKSLKPLSPNLYFLNENGRMFQLSKADLQYKFFLNF